MTITVKHSPLIKLKGCSGEIDVPAGTSVSTLLKRLGVAENQQKYLLVTANGGKQGLSYIIQDNDSLQLFLPNFRPLEGITEALRD